MAEIEVRQRFSVKMANVLPRWQREVLKIYSDSLPEDNISKQEIDHAFLKLKECNKTSLITLRSHVGEALEYVKNHKFNRLSNETKLKLKELCHPKEAT